MSCVISGRWQGFPAHGHAATLTVQAAAQMSTDLSQLDPISPPVSSQNVTSGARMEIGVLGGGFVS